MQEILDLHGLIFLFIYILNIIIKLFPDTGPYNTYIHKYIHKIYINK